MSSHQDCYISKPSKTRQKRIFQLQKDPGIQREDKISSYNCYENTEKMFLQASLSQFLL